MHVCPMVTPGVPPIPHVGGPILPPGCPTVLIGFMPAARVGDMLTCVGPPDVIAMGSPTVLIGSMLAARINDPTAHGGTIVMGFPTVMIGETGMGSPVTADMGMAAPKVSAGNTGPGPLQPAASSDSSSSDGGGGDSPAAGPSSGAAASAPPPSQSPPKKEKTWIGIQLNDFTGKPVPNQSFRVVLDQGQVLSGTTDAKGYKRFEGVDPDSGNVHFLNIPNKDEFASTKHPGPAGSSSPVTVAAARAPRGKKEELQEGPSDRPDMGDHDSEDQL
jgi:uncharacterized Zn-binding protein involved in type VI secretion